VTFFFNKSRDDHERTLAAGATGNAMVLNPMSWGAIVAGTLTALVSQLVLNLLGLGIGLSTVDPNGGGVGAQTFSIGAGIWIVLTAILTYAFGGFIAGRLAGKPLRSTAGYHGLVTWALTTVMVIVLLTSAVGSIVGGTLSAVTGAFGGAGHAVSSAVQTVAPQISSRIGGDPLAKVTDQLNQLKAAADQPNNVEARNDAIAAVKSALSSDPAQRQQATEQAAQAVAKLTNVPVDQARTQVQGYQQQYDQFVATSKQKATEAADIATKTASRGALAAALSLIVGALAAFFAGRFGAVRLQKRLADA
jgi:hypothetical protein